MKKIIFSATIIFCTHSIIAQKKIRQIEIEPLVRLDDYPNFSNSVNSISTYNIKMKGSSIGLNALYKIQIKKQLFFSFGIGYYRYTFNNISKTHRLFGTSVGRRVNYDNQLGVLLNTDKYWYNTGKIIVGLEYDIVCRKNFSIRAGVFANNYLTFSQFYHIPYNNSNIPQSELRINNNYKTFIKRNFGLGSDLSLGIIKNLKSLQLGPNLIIPVFNKWSQDEFFRSEKYNQSRSKWLKGLGIGFKIIYTKKNSREK
jgi:hypothetical protein